MAEMRARNLSVTVIFNDNETVRRTRDGARAFITARSAGGLVGCDGDGEILLVLQDLGGDALQGLRGVDTYQGEFYVRGWVC